MPWARSNLTSMTLMSNSKNLLFYSTSLKVPLFLETLCKFFLPSYKTSKMSFLTQILTILETNLVPLSLNCYYRQNYPFQLLIPVPCQRECGMWRAPIWSCSLALKKWGDTGAPLWQIQQRTRKAVALSYISLIQQARYVLTPVAFSGRGRLVIGQQPRSKLSRPQ